MPPPAPAWAPPSAGGGGGVPADGPAGAGVALPPDVAPVGPAVVSPERGACDGFGPPGRIRFTQPTRPARAPNSENRPETRAPHNYNRTRIQAGVGRGPLRATGAAGLGAATKSGGGGAPTSVSK